MDVWDTLYDQLAANPLEDFYYNQLMKSDDRAESTGSFNSPVNTFPCSSCGRSFISSPA